MNAQYEKDEDAIKNYSFAYLCVLSDDEITAIEIRILRRCIRGYRVDRLSPEEYRKWYYLIERLKHQGYLKCGVALTGKGLTETLRTTPAGRRFAERWPI